MSFFSTQRRAFVTAMAVTAVAITVRSASAALVIYDSNGFDSTTRFNPGTTTDGLVGNLRGQDAGVDQWLEAGPTGATNVSTATVQSAVKNSPNQAIQVTYRYQTNGAKSDNRWAPTMDLSAPKSITVDFDMDVLQATGAPTLDGPFFGVEVYGEGRARLGGIGVDSATGEVLYEQSAGLATTDNDLVLPFGTFAHFEEIYNFGNDTYSFSVNGTTYATGAGFLNTSNSFTDADISALSLVPDAVVGQAANQTATAYFDNYYVSTVPEPTTVGVVGGVALLALRRKNRDSRH